MKIHIFFNFPWRTLYDCTLHDSFNDMNLFYYVFKNVKKCLNCVLSVISRRVYKSFSVNRWHGFYTLIMVHFQLVDVCRNLLLIQPINKNALIVFETGTYTTVVGKLTTFVNIFLNFLVLMSNYVLCRVLHSL